MAKVNPIAHDITNSRVPTRLCDGKPAESHDMPARQLRRRTVRPESHPDGYAG